jgi:hypothetical protein
VLMLFTLQTKRERERNEVSRVINHGNNLYQSGRLGGVILQCFHFFPFYFIFPGEVPDCNGHGHCISGKCSCARGFKGRFCDEIDCPNPSCSNHGFCAEGVCICKKVNFRNNLKNNQENSLNQQQKFSSNVYLGLDW